jgi:hypothetical protein
MMSSYLTSKEKIRQWAYNEKQRLEQRLLEAQHTHQEHKSLSGSLLTIQKLLSMIK